MCFVFFDFLDELLGFKKNKSKNNNKNSFDFDSQCEYCGELLEDCECDFREVSEDDISESWENEEPENDDSFDDFDTF